MDIRESVKCEIQKIVEKGQHVNEEVIAFIKADYEKTLSDIGMGIETIQTTTEQYLEGIEAGLAAAGHKSGELMKKAAQAMLEVSKKVNDRTIEIAHQAAENAKTALSKSLEGARGSANEADESVSNTMTVAYEKFLDAGKRGKQRLEAVGQGIRAYASRKGADLSSETQKALHKTADRSKKLVKEWSRSLESYGKQLLSHSLEKTAAWLGKLSQKIKDDQ